MFPSSPLKHFVLPYGKSLDIFLLLFKVLPAILSYTSEAQYLISLLILLQFNFETQIIWNLIRQCLVTGLLLVKYFQEVPQQPKAYESLIPTFTHIMRQFGSFVSSNFLTNVSLYVLYSCQKKFNFRMRNSNEQHFTALSRPEVSHKNCTYCMCMLKRCHPFSR